MKEYVSYKDFGAVGDGVTNDFFAIKAAHEYANEKHLPVKAVAGKTYLISETRIGDTTGYISIKTDTDWCESTIIIDDTDVSYEPGVFKKFNSNIFWIDSYFEPVAIEQKYIDKINSEGGINRETVKKIETGLGYPAMLTFFNEKTRHFIRFGGNENSGSAQKELIVVDKDGNIDPSTPFLFDYTNVTSITAYRLDIPTLCLQNGTIISKASRVNLINEYRTINRGIRVIRPNCHIKNIEHKIMGELEKYEPVREDENGISYSAVSEGFYYRDGKIYDSNGEIYNNNDVKPFIGHSYNGIISIQNTHNVLIEDFTFQARVYYLQGTYDLTANMSNMMVFKNCRQSNFYGHHMPEVPKMLGLGKWWGVSGTNYCKNMIYDGCQLTRYDAHSGVWGGKIINSEVGSIRLTGGGEMLIENSKIYYWNHISPIQLREDYGVTWRGDIIIRNCELVKIRPELDLKSLIVMQSANWNFGYKTYFPNILIDNLKYENGVKELDLLLDFEQKANSSGFFYRSVRDENLAIPDAICADGKPNANPYTPPKFIKVINNEENGYEIKLPNVPFFRDTELIGVKICD